MFDRLRDNEFLCVWSIWNGLFLALLAVTTVLGWTIPVILSDESYISVGLLMIFGAGWIYSFNRVLWVVKASKNIDDYITVYENMLVTAQNPEDARESFHSSLMRKLAILEFIPRSLVMIGLVGTVVGIMIGMSEITPSMIGNAEGAGKSLATMLKGLAIGFTATLVGAAGAIWIQFQEYMIVQEVSRLYERVLSGRNSDAR